MRSVNRDLKDLIQDRDIVYFCLLNIFKIKSEMIRYRPTGSLKNFLRANIIFDDKIRQDISFSAKCLFSKLYTIMSV